MLLQQLHGEGMAVFSLGAGTGHWEPGKIGSSVRAGTLWESLTLALLSGLTVVTELWNGCVGRGFEGPLPCTMSRTRPAGPGCSECLWPMPSAERVWALLPRRGILPVRDAGI